MSYLLAIWCFFFGHKWIMKMVEFPMWNHFHYRCERCGKREFFYEGDSCV